MSTITLSIETDAGTYRHGYHYGTDENVARKLAEDVFHKLNVKTALHAPQGATSIVTVALLRDGRMFDCYGGRWDSEYAEEAWA